MSKSSKFFRVFLSVQIIFALGYLWLIFSDSSVFSLEKSGFLMVLDAYIVFLLTRSSFLLIASLKHWSFDGSDDQVLTLDEDRWPEVSVIIPAYNEEAVIKASIESVLNCDYPKMSIVIVDDASRDKTSYVVKDIVSIVENVKLVTHTINRGKAEAINTALKYACSELVVLIDADTVLKKDAIKQLVYPMLADQKISAVAGNVKVGNRKNLITYMQSLEYIVGLNLGRRAQHVMSAITTVPGAASLWKKSAIQSLGGMSSDTQVEDTDLSITALRNGHKIVYAPYAIALTEAPSDIKGLFRQRIRWLGGFLQCISKHANALCEKGHLKWFGMPDFVLINAVNFAFIAAMITTAGFYFDPMFFTQVAYSLLALLMFEALFAFTAYLQDRESWMELLLLIPHRLIWSTFMLVVFFTAIATRIYSGGIPWLSVSRVGDKLS